VTSTLLLPAAATDFKLVEVRGRKNRKTIKIDAADFDLVFFGKWSPHYDDKGRLSIRRDLMVNGTRVILLLKRVMLNAYDTSRHVIFLNDDSSDFRRSNLLLASRSQANHHRKRLSASGFRGVSQNYNVPGDLWSASLQVNDKYVWLGSFRDPVKAAKKYDARAVQEFGLAARTNFPIEEVIDAD
jgi:hypothetical protein